MAELMIYNRQARRVEPEVVYEKAVMNFLFGTRLGFWLTETALKHRWATEFYARRMHSPRSKAKIRDFINRYGINVEEVERPLDSFRSFNDFFIRKLKAEARPIDGEPSHLISCADSRLIAYEINCDTILPVKGRALTVRELLRDPLAEQ